MRRMVFLAILLVSVWPRMVGAADQNEQIRLKMDMLNEAATQCLKQAYSAEGYNSYGDTSLLQGCLGEKGFDFGGNMIDPAKVPGYDPAYSRRYMDPNVKTDSLTIDVRDMNYVAGQIEAGRRAGYSDMSSFTPPPRSNTQTPQRAEQQKAKPAAEPQKVFVPTDKQRDGPKPIFLTR